MSVPKNTAVDAIKSIPSARRVVDLIRSWQRLPSMFLHSLYIDAEADYTKSVFVCGSGRSGTTWLAEFLNYASDYRILYEPFCCDRVSICRHFTARQYLRPGSDDPRYLEPAQAIFSGKVRDAWIDQRNRPMIAHKRLVKDVRSTLMLKWVREHFPEMPIVFIVRHPCAVAISRIFRGWRPNRDEFFQQDALMADHLAPFANVMSNAQSPFEVHVVDWCVENVVPFAQLDKGDVFLTFYESICVNPAAELRRLFSFLGRPFDDSALAWLNRPSFAARKRGDRSAILTGDSLTDSWRKHVSTDELTAARRITSAFGLDEIYGDGSIPNVQRAESLLGRMPVQA